MKFDLMYFFSSVCLICWPDKKCVIFSVLAGSSHFCRDHTRGYPNNLTDIYNVISENSYGLKFTDKDHLQKQRVEAWLLIFQI